ncbi:MAG: MBL fold metallo-hydrolase [Gammaproteobacteria bacterium]|nr:MBL fold metallo-hydrolase [Gammaproteobacteria bacterium]
MPRSRLGIRLLAVLLFSCSLHGHAAGPRDGLRITVLSTNLADTRGRGEWGFSALVESDGDCVLFDTGQHPRTVLENARALDVDLSCVTDVVLSHHHPDHTGGLLTLQAEFAGSGPGAFGRVHVAAGIFDSRPLPGGVEANPMIAARAALRARGVAVHEYAEAAEILPGIWVTGPVRRVHAEQGFAADIDLRPRTSMTPDFIPESQGLAISTREGFVVLLGCGHAGVINTLSHVQSAIASLPIHAVLGGFHLHGASQSSIDWVGRQFKTLGVQQVMGAHCTAIEPLYRIRELSGLDRRTAVVGAVGARFVQGKGFEPGVLAR